VTRAQLLVCCEGSNATVFFNAACVFLTDACFFGRSLKNVSLFCLRLPSFRGFRPFFLDLCFFDRSLSWFGRSFRNAACVFLAAACCFGRSLKNVSLICIRLPFFRGVRLFFSEGGRWACLRDESAAKSVAKGAQRPSFSTAACAFLTEACRGSAVLFLGPVRF